MSARGQRGTIDNTPVLWILLVLGAVAYFNLPGERAFGTTVAFAVAGLALAGLVAAISLAPLLQSLGSRGFAEKVARELGGQVEVSYRSAWGRTVTEYRVAVTHRGRPLMLNVGAGSITVSHLVPGARVTSFTVMPGETGELKIEGPGRDHGAPLLDERVRENLTRIRELGTLRGVILQVYDDTVLVSKSGIDEKSARLLLNLCHPVVDRALSTVFGVPVAAPARVCATCGGDCCPACGSGAHDPDCGCLVAAPVGAPASRASA